MYPPLSASLGIHVPRGNIIEINKQNVRNVYYNFSYLFFFYTFYDPKNHTDVVSARPIERLKNR